MKTHCLICGLSGPELCSKHNELYIWEEKLQGFRLRKRNSGSRYTTAVYHKSEKALTKILESYYGLENVVTAFHPIWAKTSKKVLLEYDIFIKNKSILVEYNGTQHYNFPNFFHKTKKEFMDQVKRDKRKVKLAKKHNYTFIIFNYMDPMIEDYIINRIENIGVKK